MIAQPDGAAMPGRENGFEPFEEPERDDAAHAAAVDRENALAALREQMRLAGVIGGRRSAGGRRIAHPNSTFLTRNNWAQPAMSCIIAVVSANSVRPSS